ncbi:hypothetical protein A2801_00240 [Candidatus Woesebacteria bacterium RIFCSPHIGHO2_01_FULL_41_10]|uniref:Phage holin family protein n=1 Tax=Candidatus Woesebacteria bacterium RIFCSPHIGHO2_01_FULL_41_10 TaxID=1802500 RepID=A0A1F7YRD9_9BACT|nr:MAG: hypothetical protein A2801_00240 [Candidatus Woesebacteria bacterium RIFCSPHIGHO2_01_FULL_41_10]
MKKIIRLFAIEIFALYLTDQIAHGLIFSPRLEGILITGVALTFAVYIIRPLLGVLLLPLTLATLGIFRFLAHAVTLYIVDRVVEQFAVEGFSFAGASVFGREIPSLHYTNPIAYLAFAVVLWVVTAIVRWIMK